eukprot:1358887-Amorphochlora_amoeboformis.AAC.1
MGMEGWDTDLFSRSLSPPVPFLFLILLCTVPADTAPRAEVPNSTEILVLIRDQASPVDSTLVEDLKASLVAQGLPPSRIHTLTSFKKRNGCVVRIFFQVGEGGLGWAAWLGWDASGMSISPSSVPPPAISSVYWSKFNFYGYAS